MNLMFRLLVILLLSASLLRAQDGIYADFSTSMGDFTCQLHYDKVPRTVANFIGLATGERGWLDIPSGDAKRTPFYNGIIFHRVVSGFVIQGGSPNGQGTDGPGYTFRDEFDPTLRHNAAGVLSMANSGSHSNGSQFFVTLAPTSHLNDVHSVFGTVTSGLSVVQAIGGVAVDGSSKPLTPVVMNSVTIRRVGAAAEAFDIHAQGLPGVGGAAPVMTNTGSNSALQFNRALYSEYWLYNSTSLATWTRQRLGLYVSTPPTADLDVTATAVGQNQFYRIPQITYPGPIFTPPTVSGATFNLTFNGSNSLVIALNTSGGGTLNLNNGNPTTTITQYTWNQEAYRGSLYVTSGALVPLYIHHVFTSATGGTIKGTAYTSPSTTPITGTFTFTP